jgi:hypothetical protein
MYTAAEYAEMLIIYGECRRNAREDAREYAIRFPRRLPLSFDDDGRRSIFEKLYLPQTYQYFRRTK